MLSRNFPMWGVQERNGVVARSNMEVKGRFLFLLFFFARRYEYKS